MGSLSLKKGEIRLWYVLEIFLQGKNRNFPIYGWNSCTQLVPWMASLKNYAGQITIETDSETTIKCFQGNLKVANLELVILDCIGFACFTSHCICCFFKRSRHNASHGLVKVAVNLGSKSWVGCNPKSN